MNRREFIKKSAFFSVLGVIAGAFSGGIRKPKQSPGGIIAFIRDNVLDKDGNYVIPPNPDVPKTWKAMHEFKHGVLKSSSGKKVTNRKQSIAISMSEAGINKRSKKSAKKSLKGKKSHKRKA